MHADATTFAGSANTRAAAGGLGHKPAHPRQGGGQHEERPGAGVRRHPRRSHADSQTTVSAGEVMRVVLDTNVLARSTKYATGPARGCFLRFESGQHTLVVSTYLLAELARVLTYPRLMARHGLSPEEVREFLAAVETVGEMVATPLDSVEAIVSADPEDDP